MPRIISALQRVARSPEFWMAIERMTVYGEVRRHDHGLHASVSVQLYHRHSSMVSEIGLRYTTAFETHSSSVQTTVEENMLHTFSRYDTSVLNHDNAQIVRRENSDEEEEEHVNMLSSAIGAQVQGQILAALATADSTEAGEDGSEYLQSARVVQHDQFTSEWTSESRTASKNSLQARCLQQGAYGTMAPAGWQKGLRSFKIQYDVTSECIRLLTIVLYVHIVSC